ncbi:MAG: DNA repair protein RecO [Xanthomonadales bacterium]|nr:DNA repair protein RecO [Gammaproteobacteria bacterium]MBT8053260.1 DNA repair protein RecO [Gammaproteobacteria bacterium]NND56045.1 DNA repair protein RecO [Xanthomonadales bacterium]NNK50300.1 DNA repair protein RecO [Xanthomonadales bacterium]
MRVSLEPSYVLHARPFQESSLLIEALSRSHGRVGLVARGARGVRSRWKGVLQPFRPLLLSWSQKGELGTLTAADQVASPPPLAGESLFCGLYANELTTRFLQRSDPHPGLFERYRQLVAELAVGDPAQPALRIYELQLLQAAGFGLQLEHEFGTSDPVREDAWYRYVPESGPKLRKYEEDRAGELISGAALLGLKSGQIEDRHLKELKALMRRLIRFYLGDKPLKSQSLFH